MNAVFWDIKTQFVSHGRHITPPQQSPGFQGCDYEECRLVRYKTLVRTSQEEPMLLILCKMWGFHGGDYEEFRLVRYKNPVRTSQETRYVSATQPNRLTLCKIWGFHGGDYEECRLLGYENPVRTSQEKHYVSATQPSRLMLCKMWGFHDCSLKNFVLWYVTLFESCNSLLSEECIASIYRSEKSERNKKDVGGRLTEPEDEGYTFLPKRRFIQGAHRVTSRHS
jgi:hypothetical protein